MKTSSCTQSVVNAERRKFLYTSSALAASSLALGSTALAQTQPQPKPQPHTGIRGQIAPELEVDYWIDANGEPSTFSIEASKGKWTLLKCFQNWCPGCHKHGFPTLKEFSDRFHDNPKVAIAGIQTVFEGYSTNTQDAVRELQLRYELPIVMGHDPGNKEAHTPPSTMRKYNTGGTPWLILINPDGVVTNNHFHVDAKHLIEFVARQIA